ncbi:MAG: hypothetical protein ABI588_08015 [Arenimonas sp.]
MRRIRVACCLLLIALVPVAQASISLPVPWKQGMQLRYRSQSVQEKVKGKLHTRIQTQDVTELSILEADAAGYVQRWRSVSPEVAVTGDGDQVASERKVAQALVARFRNLPLEATLGPKGEYRGLRNWQALGAAMREVMLPALVEQTSARKDLKGTPPEELKARLGPALDRLTTQAAVDASLGRQVAIFNYFTAPTIARGKPVTYEDNLPSPWSSDLIPSRGSFELVAVDDKAGTITIRWQQGIDANKGRDAIWKMVGTLGLRRSDGAGADGLPKGMVLKDEATVVLQRATGLPVRIEHRRQVGLGAASSTNSWTFEKLPDRTAR